MSLTTPDHASQHVDHDSHRAEAARIYRAIFGDEVPGVVAERFVGASAALDPSVAPEALVAYRLALDRVGDLEALEVACRYARRLPLLSRKFRLMVYLAETIPDNRERFINDRDAVLAGYTVVALGALRTAFKLVKGFTLLRRLDRA